MWAQETKPTQQAPTMPSTAELPAVGFAAAGQGQNTLAGGISFSSSLRRRLAAAPGTATTSFYDAAPWLALRQHGRRMYWSLGYRAALQWQQGELERTNLGLNQDFELRYAPRPRWELRLRESFVITRNPFDQLDRDLTAPAFAFFGAPNDTVLLSHGERTQLVGNFDVTYQPRFRHSVGLGGMFTDTRLKALIGETKSEVLFTRGASGRAFYYYRFNRSTTIGVAYNLQNLTFRQGDARVVTHTPVYMHAVEFTPRTSLSLFVGPEYVRSHDNLLVRLFLPPFIILRFRVRLFDTHWGWTGGSVFAWQTDRTLFRLAVQRRVTDGGGLAGAVLNEAVDLGFRRRLSRRLTWGLDGRYGQNETLTSGSSQFRYEVVGGSTGFDWSLRENLRAALTYAYFRNNRGFGLDTAAADAQHMLRVALQLHFIRPRGR